MATAFDIRWLAECDSTNTQALQHLRDGGGPLLIAAERQTAGRGRQGRRWLAEPGAALTFSLAVSLPVTLDLSGLSLAVGCALADALDPTGQRIRLKWPNDLFLDGAKLGGILIETLPLAAGQRGLVVGIGINLAPLPPAADRSAYASGHAALRSLIPTAQGAALLNQLEPALRHLLADFQSCGGFAPWQAAFERRDLCAGQAVRVGSRAGIARGVSASGELLLDEAGQISAITAGEVSLRLDAPCAP